ncbi:MAG: YggS family pyridoxal phosphate-dependent enzyme [Actinomycetaceae bacterium]|nr:YggS family pyridoxal phosphate-dependent enzyme [Actinomycetaceae bacterium]
MLELFDMAAVPDLAEIGERYQALCETVRACEASAGRESGSVRVELAAKYQSPERVLAALQAGAELIGHNLIQQLVAGEEALSELDAPAHRTHVIGHLQKNKAGKALAYADCIETVDSLELAQRLNRLAGERGKYLDIFLQVNSSGAPSQFGIAPEQALDLVGQIADLKHLRIAGLMTIGAHSDDTTEIARSFELTRNLREDLQDGGIASATELSMGMTGDMEIAIAEGSTIIRVGTAVFGPRP